MLILTLSGGNYSANFEEKAITTIKTLTTEGTEEHRGNLETMAEIFCFEDKSGFDFPL